MTINRGALGLLCCFVAVRNICFSVDDCFSFDFTFSQLAIFKLYYFYLGQFWFSLIFGAFSQLLIFNSHSNSCRIEQFFKNKSCEGKSRNDAFRMCSWHYKLKFYVSDYEKTAIERKTVEPVEEVRGINMDWRHRTRETERLTKREGEREWER